ncbi:MAG TPA: serine hydrolase [Blastocatellia bacterium]|nr:serine hydrolase [Blastocatellia bacterium]
MFQCLRFGIRLLRKNPRFIAAAALSLAFGAGANMAVLSVSNTRLIPYTQAEQHVIAGAGNTTPDPVEPGKRDLERPNSNSPPALTAVDVATFFDTLIPPHLRRDDIPGAVVAIVKDGQTLFAKGYGYADVAAKRPVTVDATLFRIASISKLFAWTAVMQLVELGKLDLDRDLGFYLAQNGVGGDLPNIAWRYFFDRYFPNATPVAEAPADAGADHRELIGSYKQSRRFDTSIYKLYSLFNQSRVFRFTDGALGFDGVNDYGRQKPLRQVSQMVYRAVDGPERIEFRRGVNGALEIVTDFSFHILQRVPWYENKRLNTIVICAIAAVFVLTLLLWPVGALTRWRYGRRLKLSRANRLARVFIRLVCALNLTFILAGYALFWRLPDPSVNSRVHLLQAAGIIGAVGTLIVLFDAVRCWADRERWWFSKVHALVLGLACLCFVGFALIWRLFDFSLPY